jgi:hypothetical protein
LAGKMKDRIRQKMLNAAPTPLQGRSGEGQSGGSGRQHSTDRGGQQNSPATRSC